MPRNPKVACSVRGCPNLCEPGQKALCDKHRKEAHRRYNQERTDKDIKRTVYDKRAWQTARNAALQRAGGWCEMCKERPAAVVDHIVEVKDGGAHFDLNNLQALCHKCHAIKTARNKRSVKQNERSEDFVVAI
jgi:5-methylcytosine-specific restriction protein A